MHELGIAQQIVESVAERVDGAPVSRLVLEIGRLSGVLPDAVRFSFDLCVEGTPLEGATLEIVETPGMARCRSCAEPVTLERFFGYCACGSSDLDWEGGDQVRVIQIEVAATP